MHGHAHSDPRHFHSDAEGHHHHPGKGAHHHAHTHSSGAPALTWALALTLIFCAVEAVAGILSGSLALLSDAGHMLTDSLALAIAALAATLSRRPPTLRHTYGLQRAEIIAALANGVAMLALVGWIAIQATHRLFEPQPVSGPIVTAVAAAGLLVNIAAASVLMRGEQDLNVRAALLHVMGDLLGSVAALAAGLVIVYSGWTPIDPLLSLLVSGLILVSTLRLLRSAFATLMEAVPDGLSVAEIGQAMAQVEGVHSIHDLHVWNLGSAQTALSAHVVLRRLDLWPQVLTRLRAILRDRFGISHLTLQPETPAAQPLVFHPDGQPPRGRGA